MVQRSVRRWRISSGWPYDDVEPFGLAGSAGSTPLRITVGGDPPRLLFGKLYAKSHLRADRWYKLGRELLYGRLEDEKPFNTVRRLVQQEDYALSLMQRAGLPSPAPFGFVETHPRARVPAGHRVLRRRRRAGRGRGRRPASSTTAWASSASCGTPGLAHRDIKPANLLVRDGRMLLIDVAFVQTRPSPWRQAVDLANMMLCLALRSDPERVYERALRQFTVDEVSEGFAAARGLALPSQLRHLLRDQGRDLHAEFVRLLPAPPRPIRIQRWSIRRIALWAVLGILLVLAASNARAVYDDWFGGGLATETSLHIDSLGCDEWKALWLQAQAVPSATFVPCVGALPAGWTLANVAVNKGRSVLTFDVDQAGPGAVEMRLTAACTTADTAEVRSEHPGVRRYERTERTSGAFAAVRYDRFAGGCVISRLHSATDLEGRFATELPNVLAFTSRAELENELRTRSDGRLHLDPA